MKIIKLLAVALLSASLYSCNECEDVNLGKLEFTDELTSFLPVQGKNYSAVTGGTRLRMSYSTPSGSAYVQIPVQKINYSGKFDPDYCKEYYTAEEKEYTGQIEGGSPFSIKFKLRKDANPQRFNTIYDKDAVGDVLEFAVGYNTVFPEAVTHGSHTYTNYTAQRTFLFLDTVTSNLDRITYTQEYLPTVTLQGVQHESVYHLYLNDGYSYDPTERYLHQYYPLDYIKGIYMKKGVGLLHAYTAGGKQVTIAVE
ncbi:MAG: hypothetical protein LPK07_08390 [Hymenobacteraceae bacterium]|nr:hypothetical protein [Hymenobacteraceae bacterium]